MSKRLITLGMVLVMLFSLAGLIACDTFDLVQYKTAAKSGLEAYAKSKGEKNYTADNWTVLLGCVTNGKDEIDAATSTTDVDTAVQRAERNIDKVECELSEELENRIKTNYLQEFGHEFWFDRFYGLFNGAAVFFIVGESEAIKTVIISGIEFSYKCGWTIIVWKDGKFYNLEEIETIFDAGILTKDDLVQIGIIHAEFKTKEEKVNKINYTLSLGRMDYGSITNIETIINSIDEWMELKDVLSLPELKGKYNELFFVENAIIVFALGRGTRGAEFEKVEVYEQDNSLVVEVFDNGGGYMDMTSNWIVVLEVNKADIVGFQNIHLKTNFYSFYQ